MLIVIHDFAPVFAGELRTIIETLSPIVRDQFSAAVVPRWRGQSGRCVDSGYRELLNLVPERLLHGRTHESRHPWHPISLLTARADEFRGLPPAEIYEQLRVAQAEFGELTGEAAQGLLPPAWQLPVDFVGLPSLRFVMRFRRLECCRDPLRFRSLATWSWDWGRLGWLSRGGELIGGLLLRHNPLAVPCVAIHPADVSRGCLPHAVRVINQLINSGYQPTTATELMLDTQWVSRESHVA